MPVDHVAKARLTDPPENRRERAFGVHEFVPAGVRADHRDVTGRRTGAEPERASDGQPRHRGGGPAACMARRYRAGWATSASHPESAHVRYFRPRPPPARGTNLHRDP